jgi:hypothetical protein
MIAALRYMAQLTIIAIVLQHVLVSMSVWIVAGIARTFFDNIFTRTT